MGWSPLRLLIQPNSLSWALSAGATSQSVLTYEENQRAWTSFRVFLSSQGYLKVFNKGQYLRVVNDQHLLFFNIGLLTFSLMIDQNGFVFSGLFLFARQFIHFSKIGSTQSMLNGGCGFDDEFYVNFLSLKQPMLSLLPLFPAALVSMRSWFHRFEHLRQISMRWVWVTYYFSSPPHQLRHSFN